MLYIHYRVRPGDALSVIAERYDLTVGDLLRANPQLTDPDDLLIGQQLRVPLPPEPSSEEKLVFGARVSPAFRSRVREIAAELEVSPDFLMAVMAFETGETFRPDVHNGTGSGAVGLIQFMPATARQLGVQPADLEQLTAEQQLDYVARYFRPFKGALKSLEDVYMAVLLPKAVGQTDDFVLFTSPGRAYDQNRGLDLDGDGRITKAEAAARVRQKLERGQRFSA